jgi:hypothetical protein
MGKRAVVGRKVRGPGEAVELLKAWSASGEPMSTWCAARGVNWYSLSAYMGWQVRHQPDAEGHGGDQLVELVATADVETVEASPATYRIALRDVVVEVDGDFEDEPLRRLLRVVASC